MLVSMLPHGERPSLFTYFVVQYTFQSTLPHGERHQVRQARETGDSVSIHAPAWGATTILARKINRACGFNPRSRTGSDDCGWCLVLVTHSFNPRSRTGSDLHCHIWGGQTSCFNPRSRTGSDHCKRAIANFLLMFQSTLPHGERRHPIETVVPSDSVSIHAPARGATSHIVRLEAIFTVSIHAPARGATVMHKARLQQDVVSIHAPARGATF